MKFKAKEPSLVVFVKTGKQCAFKNGFYETENPEEIEALKKARGVKIVEGEKQETPDNNCNKKENTKEEKNPSPQNSSEKRGQKRTTTVKARTLKRKISRKKISKSKKSHRKNSKVNSRKNPRKARKRK